MTADVLEAEAVAWDAPAREPWHGLLDYYGYHAPSGAWYFVGWVEQRHIAPGKPTTADLRIDFESGTLSGAGIVTYFFRPDLGERGSGVVVHFPSSGRGIGRPVWMELCSDERSAGLTVPSGCQHLRGVASYNETRPHQGRWCYGKTPMQTFLDAAPLAREKIMAA